MANPQPLDMDDDDEPEPKEEPKKTEPVRKIKKDIDIVCKQKRMSLPGDYLLLSDQFASLYEGDQTITEWDVSSNATPEISEYMAAYLEAHKGIKPAPLRKPLPSVLIGTLVSDWDYKFINAFDHDTLMELLNVAFYFQITSLLQLCCAKIVCTMKTGDPQDVLRMFSRYTNPTIQVHEIPE